MHISGDRDSFDSTVSEVCCQGAQVLCGKVGSSIANSSETTQLRPSECGHIEPVTVISGKVPIDNIECGIEILVPCCQTESFGPCECSLNTSNREHPSTVDVLTVLILALPSDTWVHLKDAKLREDFCDLVSTNNLPDLLQQEVSTILLDAIVFFKCPNSMCWMNNVCENLVTSLCGIWEP